MTNKKPKRKVDRKALDAEKKKPCAACGGGPSDPAHIKTVKSGGADEATNVMPLCRMHHTEQHKVGWVRMSGTYLGVLEALTERNWEITEEFGRTRLTRKVQNEL